MQTNLAASIIFPNHSPQRIIAFIMTSCFILNIAVSWPYRHTSINYPSSTSTSCPIHKAIDNIEKIKVAITYEYYIVGGSSVSDKSQLDLDPLETLNHMNRSWQNSYIVYYIKSCNAKAKNGREKEEILKSWTQNKY